MIYIPLEGFNAGWFTFHWRDLNIHPEGVYNSTGGIQIYVYRWGLKLYWRDSDILSKGLKVFWRDSDILPGGVKILLEGFRYPSWGVKIPLGWFRYSVLAGPCKEHVKIFKKIANPKKLIIFFSFVLIPFDQKIQGLYIYWPIWGFEFRSWYSATPPPL